MLKPAQLYADELQKQLLNTWYTDRAKYWNGCVYDSVVELREDNGDAHQFVSVESNGILLGYITYAVSWTSCKAYGFGIISFEQNPVVFTADFKQAVDDIFKKYRLNKIEFSAYADNPAIKTYRRFIAKHGGEEVGTFKQTTKLQDGLLHDCTMFELFREDYLGIN